MTDTQKNLHTQTHTHTHTHTQVRTAGCGNFQTHLNWISRLRVIYLLIVFQCRYSNTLANQHTHTHTYTHIHTYGTHTQQ